MYIYCIVTTNYTYTYACRNNDAIKTNGHSSLEKYTFHFIERVVCERELETEQNCNILTPTLMAITAFLSCSPGLLNWGPGGPASAGTWFSFQHLLFNSNCSIGGPEGPPLLGAGYLYSILSPTNLNFLCTKLYYCFTPTQSLPITGQRNMQLPPSLE